VNRNISGLRCNYNNWQPIYIEFLIFRKLGAKNELLTAEKLKQKFPWLNTNGIALGCHGLENEGW